MDYILYICPECLHCDFLPVVFPLMRLCLIYLPEFMINEKFFQLLFMLSQSQ